jgi:transposase-like protein
MAGRQRDPKREKFWRDVLERQRSSGLSISAFCAGRGLAQATLYAWRRILRQRDAQRPPAPPAFVAMEVRPAETAGDGQVTLELRGGHVLRLPITMAPAQLAAVVCAIEAGSGQIERMA